MRALLVEDERRIASDISRALEASGYVVETVSNGEEPGSGATPRTTARDPRSWPARHGRPCGPQALARERATHARPHLDRPWKLGRAGRRDRCRRRRLPAEAVPDGGTAGPAALDRAALCRPRIVGDYGRGLWLDERQMKVSVRGVPIALRRSSIGSSPICFGTVAGSYRSTSWMRTCTAMARSTIRTHWKS